jgi:hypothetical protein
VSGATLAKQTPEASQTPPMAAGTDWSAWSQSRRRSISGGQQQRAALEKPLRARSRELAPIARGPSQRGGAAAAVAAA